MSSSVTFVDNSAAWMAGQRTALMGATKRMGNAIMATARMKAPMKDGNLRNSGRVNQEGNVTIISFGDGRSGLVPYAHAQEAGTNGRVVFRKYTTPGTGAHYLEDAGNRIVKEGLKKYL